MAMKEIEVEAADKILVDVPKDNKRLFIQLVNGTVQVSNDKCKHRGGPIHLCYLDKNNHRRCPWHDRRVGKDETCEEIAAIYFQSAGVLRLISEYEEDDIWPVRKVGLPLPGETIPNSIAIGVRS